MNIRVNFVLELEIDHTRM